MRQRELGCKRQHETYVGGPAAGMAGQVLNEVPEKRYKLDPQVGGLVVGHHKTLSVSKPRK